VNLKPYFKIFTFLLVLFVPANSFGQHHSQIIVEVNIATKTLNIQQEITFFNQSEDTLKAIVLNDWIHAYSSRNTALAERFSDEFYREFHLASEKELGNTNNLTIIDNSNLFLSWKRPEATSDFIAVELRTKLAPNQKIVLHLTYSVKIPSDKFTKYGYSEDGGMNLKNWFLTPARFENHDFIQYDNNNLDDIANAVSDFDIDLKIPKNVFATTDLNSAKIESDSLFTNYKFDGKNRTDFSLFIEPKTTFYNYKNSIANVAINLKETKINTTQEAVVVDKVVTFVDELIGHYPFEKIIVSQTDYERYPFYGLNQLPSFLSPFPDEFIFEIKFLKTYLNNYLKNSLHLNPRKDNWIYDGIQVYAMMKYIDENHPDMKMFGSLSTYKLLKGFNLTNVNFNEQYSYFYMLMARKNLDQPLGNPKNTLIKFNEQIASKYRAGLSFRYLDDYLGDETISASIHQFYDAYKSKQVQRLDFETIIKANSKKDIDWFFKTIIDSRDIIDYKFSEVSKTKNNITFSINNRTGVFVPIPVYGVKKDVIVFKKWIDSKNIDSVFTIDRKNADKIVLNYKNEVPEYNLRNNWKSLKNFYPNNRPLKFTFMKDLEDSYYNQILYVPTLTYNLYDGLSPGLRLHNKTILDKPFSFDLNPAYSTSSSSLSGAASFDINNNYRDGNLYNIRYSMSGDYFHYAPDAAYQKINPSIQFRFRQSDFRDNRKQLILIRQVLVNREKSNFITDITTENYSVFNIKYINTKTEVVHHFNLITDFQMSSKFGKLAGEIQYRKLFDDNREFSIRLFAGSFLYNKTNSNFFSFALDRPTDYLFDYNYYGRSESSGFFSQQFILADGGFKSKLDTPFANQWLTSINVGYTIWNFVEVYSDFGLLKNKFNDPKFVYDSGIRLNLVTNYFEFYFPIYSNNRWEIYQNKYNEKIRFVITFDPKLLINLFTRKWF
jgi:hypothetical protein